MTPRPHNSRAPQPFAASRSRSPIHSAQLMAELWRVAGKRACCRGLMSLVFNRTLGPTEPGFSQHECSSILTHLDNNPRCFPGFKMMEIKVDESKSEAQAPSPSPSAIGPPVEVGREPSPVPAPTPAPTIASGAVSSSPVHSTFVSGCEGPSIAVLRKGFERNCAHI